MGEGLMLMFRRLVAGLVVTSLCVVPAACGAMTDPPMLPPSTSLSTPVSLEGAGLRVDTPCRTRTLVLDLSAAEPALDRPVDVVIWKNGETVPFAAVTVPAGPGNPHYEVPLPAPDVRGLAFGARNPEDRELTRRVGLLGATITCEG